MLVCYKCLLDTMPNRHRKHSSSSSSSDSCHRRRGVIHDVSVAGPGIDDRFSPYALTIESGDSVRWTNREQEEPHTVTSVDQWNSTEVKRLRVILAPGQSFTQQFRRPGLLIVRCEIHSHLDDLQQPIAPGPGVAGKIYDPATDCPAGVESDILFCEGDERETHENYGTPMTNVIAVRPRRRHH